MAGTLSKIDASEYLVDGEALAGTDLAAEGTSGYVLTSNGSSTKPSWQENIAPRVLIETQEASSSATIEFNNLTDTYTSYEVRLFNVAPASDDQILLVRTSTDNGSTFDSTSGDYEYAVSSWSSGGSNQINSSSTTGTSIQLTATGATWGWGNAANETGSGLITIYNPSDANYTLTESKLSYYGAGATLIHSTGSGSRETTTAVDAIQFLFGSGNISSGTFKLYGLI